MDLPRKRLEREDASHKPTASTAKILSCRKQLTVMSFNRVLLPSKMKFDRHIDRRLFGLFRHKKRSCYNADGDYG